MSLPLYFHPRVRPEMDEAFAWYESQRLGRGEEFLRSVRAASIKFETIQRCIRQSIATFRRVLIRRFPCVVYYKVESDHISVIAVYHGKRDPAGWKSRS